MKQGLFIMVLTALLFSCTKKEVSSPATNPSNPPPPVYSISDYTKLTAGNYWIYAIVDIDTLGNITQTGTDSCYIKGDSVMNGNTYVVAVNMPPAGQNSKQLLRDSSSFLVDQHGTIFLTLTDFNTVLLDDSVIHVSNTKYSVPSQQSMVIVPIGTYLCYNYQGMATFYQGYKWGPVRYTDNYYAPNVGLVCAATFNLNSPGTIQYWLIQAHVQ